MGDPGTPRSEPEPEEREGEELRCDFCGRTAVRVRRVALDGSYERLQTPHAVRYACQACSEEKERRRLGG
jgi:hypothetical protein